MPWALRNTEAISSSQEQSDAAAPEPAPPPEPAPARPLEPPEPTVAESREPAVGMIPAPGAEPGPEAPAVGASDCGTPAVGAPVPVASTLIETSWDDHRARQSCKPYTGYSGLPSYRDIQSRCDIRR